MSDHRTSEDPSGLIAQFKAKNKAAASMANPLRSAEAAAAEAAYAEERARQLGGTLEAASAMWRSLVADATSPAEQAAFEAALTAWKQRNHQEADAPNALRPGRNTP